MRTQEEKSINFRVFSIHVKLLDVPNSKLRVNRSVRKIELEIIRLGLYYDC